MRVCDRGRKNPGLGAAGGLEQDTLAEDTLAALKEMARSQWGCTAAVVVAELVGREMGL